MADDQTGLELPPDQGFGNVQAQTPLQTFRAKYPAYNDLSDDQVVTGLHKKFYSDVPLSTFQKYMGGPAAMPLQPQGRQNEIYLPPSDRPEARSYLRSPAYEAEHPGFQPPPMPPEKQQGSMPWSGYGKELEEQHNRDMAVWGAVKDAWNNTPQLLTDLGQKWADKLGLGHSAQTLDIANRGFQAIWSGGIEAANQFGEAHGMPMLGRDLAGMVESAGMTGGPGLVRSMRGPEGFAGRAGPYYALSPPPHREPVAGELSGTSPQPPPAAPPEAAAPQPQPPPTRPPGMPQQTAQQTMEDIANQQAAPAQAAPPAEQAPASPLETAPPVSRPEYPMVPPHPAPDGSGAWTNLSDEDYWKLTGKTPGQPAQPAPVSPTGQPATPEAAALARDAQPAPAAPPVPPPPVAPQPAPVPVPPKVSPQPPGDYSPEAIARRKAVQELYARALAGDPEADAELDRRRAARAAEEEVAAQRAGVETATSSRVPTPSGGAAPYRMLDPSAIKLDPERFQYKAADTRGITGALLGGNRWEPDLANPITAWEDKEGNLYAVNGHQRTDLAQRAKAAGQENVQVPARVMREEDGYTPEYMRALGAYQNIAEGSGTAIDAARVLRGRDSVPPDRRLPDLPPRSALVQQAIGLAALDPRAFAMVESGTLAPAYAAMVGQQIKSPEEQIAAIDALTRANLQNAEQARLMVQDIRESGFLSGAQTTLFGEEQFATSLFPERARILENALRVLRRNRSVFKSALEGEGTLTGAGNVLSREGNVAGRTDNERLIDRLNDDATRKGPLSDALSEAARSLADGRPIAGVTTGFLQKARGLERRGEIESVRPSPPDGGAVDEGQEGLGLAVRRGAKYVPGQADIFGQETPPPAPKGAAEPTIRNDPRQQQMFPEAGPSAVQAQAARDQTGRGMLTGKGEQRPADEGLFAEKPPEQPGLFAEKPPAQQKFTSATDLTSKFPQYTPENVHNMAVGFVFEQGRATGYEHMVIVHGPTGEVLHAGTDNKRNTVGVSPVEGFTTEPGSLVLIHNHPLPRGLSRNDHAALGGPAIGHVVAVDHNGTLFAISASPAWKNLAIARGYQATANLIRGEVKETSRIVFDHILEPLLLKGRISPEEAEKYHDDVVSRLMDANGHTLYMTTQALPPAIVKQLRAFLGHSYDENKLSRLTGSVRNDDIFASLPQAVGGDRGGENGLFGQGRIGPGQGVLETAGGEGEEGNPLYSFPGPLLDPAAWRRAAAPLLSAAGNPRSFIANSPRLKAITDRLVEGASSIINFNQLHVAPMSHTPAATEARAMAKDWANLDRLARWEGHQTINWGRKTFTMQQRRNMWEAANADSEYMQELEAQGLPVDRLQPGGGGIRDLTPEEQGAVQAWQDEATQAFDLARRVGIHNSPGLPSYVPRMIVDVVNGIRQRFGEGGPGAQSELVRDILNLPLATMRLRQAIAGRVLVNQIQAYGQRTGQTLVREMNEENAETQTINRNPSPGGKDIVDFGNNVTTTTPQMRRRKYLTAQETEEAAQRKRDWLEEQPFKYFTIKSNPAFWTWKWGGIDDSGQPYFRRVPIEVRKDFEGPLRAIMNNVPAGDLGRAMNTTYRGLMDLKGRMMTSIMYGVAHLGVVASRAMPAARTPWNFVRMWKAGGTAKDNPDTMRELIMAGMAPIGSRMGFRDLSGMIDDPQLAPGRSWTSKMTGFVPGIFDPRAGEAARRGIDALGDFMHNRLLWDQVQSIQVGLSLDIADYLEKQGFDRQTALRIATRFGNNYVGAIPREAMSQWARGIANLALFSRSYRMGNLSAIKDAFVGLPRDVQAQIERDKPQLLDKAQSYTKRKAWTTLALDIGFALIASGIIQNLVNIGNGMGPDQQGLPADASLPQRARAEVYGYWRRMAAELQRVENSPFDALNPFAVMESLTPMGEHEPGKENRLLIGYDNNGTGIYARLPLGKVYEDLTDYWTEPRDILKRMLSPYAAPISEWWTNETGFGQQIWDPLSDTPSDMMHGLWKWTKLIMEQPFPWATNIYSALHHEQGPGMTSLQIAGGAVGLSISRGMPGGPDVGKVVNAQKRLKFQQQEAMPGIRDMIRGGDLDGARQQMNSLKFPPWEQRAIERSTLHPGLSKSQEKFRSRMMEAP